MTRHISAFSKDFILMAIGQIISLFGNQILHFALPLYLLNQTGSVALFGTISAISFVPMILLFPIGGIIADRVNKRNIMVILDFSTSALVLLFSVTVNSNNIVPLIATAMLSLYLPFCVAAFIAIAMGISSHRLFVAVENELKQSQSSQSTIK